MINSMRIYPALHPNAGDLLIPQTHEHHGGLFQGTDSRSLYEESLRTQAPDWIYRTKPVTYTWNTNGYRAPEWSAVDFEASILVMGCSHIAGVGLDDKDTVSECLTRLMGIPCINLGVGGGSSDVLLYNSLRLIDLGHRPQAVVCLAPDATRMAYFGTPTHNLGSWLLREKDYSPFYTLMYQSFVGREPNAELHGYMSQRGISDAWRAVGVPVRVWQQWELARLDQARDLAHPGVKTAQHWADVMAEWLHQNI